MAGLHVKGVRPHLQMFATRHIKNTRVECRMPKALYDVLPHVFQIQLFIYFSVHIVTFGFSCTSYFLNTLKHI